MKRRVNQKVYSTKVKENFVSEWGEKIGVPTSFARAYYDALLDLFVDRLIDGDEVPMTGIGVLCTENPENKPRTVSFRPSDKLNKTLRDYPIEEEL